MEDILVPIFICVVLPVTVVWLVARTRQNEANKKADIMLKAIEAGVPVDMEQFNTDMKKTPKTIKQGLLDKLSGACITSLIGIAFIVLFLVNQYGPGVDFFFDNMFPIAGVILLAAEQESLRRFLLSLCGDAAEADDIAQDALVNAYVASSSFRGAARFSTWLFRIAYNCYIDNCRKSRPEDAPLQEAVALQSGDSSDRSFRYQQLYQALEKLPEKEKAAIALFYFEDRSIKEISAILDMPQGTVKYQLSMGRQHLKQHIQL